MFQKYVLICFLLKFLHLLKLILENINNFGKGTTYTNGAKNDGKTHACRLVTIVTNSLLQFIDKILTINWFVEKINKFKIGTNFRNTLYMNVSLFCCDFFSRNWRDSGCFQSFPLSFWVGACARLTKIYPLRMPYVLQLHSSNLDKSMFVIFRNA